jgi:putative ABC transport system permease protein
MIDLDRFQEIASTMRRNALRTFLTAVGVFWGVFLLILMVGFGNGLERGTQRSMSGLATNSLYLWGQRTSVPFQGRAPGRSLKLTLDDAEALRTHPGVALVAPRANLGGRRAAQPVVRGKKTGNFRITGDTPAYLTLEPMDIRGRFINPLDMKERRKVAVIGSRVIEVLFEPDENPIGETITVQGIDFLVVGTFETFQAGERGASHAETIYLPLTTFQKALTGKPYVDYMAILSEPEVRAGAIEQDLARVIGKRHQVAPNDKQAVGSFNADEQFQKIVNLFRGINLLIVIVAGATLLAGLVGVSNIMMVSVRERTREIGIRKAIGATPRTVIAQVVSEAVVLASVAGYLGLVAGVGLLELVAPLVSSSESTMFAPPSVSLQTALVAAVAVALGGGLAGLFPALHAARIRTVEALRDE